MPEFVSKRYGYEIAPGKAYYVQFATTQWQGTFPFGGGASVDTFLDFRDRKFIVAAMNVPASMSLSEWESKHVARMQSFCKKAYAFRDSTFGGVPAMGFMDICPD